ncbi:hypothetical protein JX266_013173 [Neoarthrinium moseri]|uniref:uncharacterized protein n=1 Tax=Neoarthrinium moseri TaxID=1658444 RepID=UPI001FDBBDDB|nr:uncharacterized protein JN550_008157 [Neoarthrinium moseri]KAI1840621.1 hypothetical protein JX266_013173 [Neoarthrinium moseri]KAI1865899.1 hypothetical protein JN550_008157 [Neoarthrinium moseri]
MAPEDNSEAFSKDPFSGLERFLLSTDWSDLTIICEGRELPAHKVILCSYSPVVAAALNSNLKEARTNTIEIQFDLATVCCMLFYMYSGDYDIQKGKLSALGFNAPKNDAKTGLTRGSTDTTEISEGSSVLNSVQICRNGDPEAPVIQELLDHAKMNKIGDYYQVPALVKMSNFMMDSILKSSWSTKAFISIVNDLFESTGDTEWQKMLASHVADNIVQLGSDTEALAQAKDLSPLTREIISACADRIQVVEASRKKSSSSTGLGSRRF